MEKQDITEKIKELTKHKYIKLTNCCNSAILLSFIIAKTRGIGTILIPDQGGWLTYQSFPPILNLKLKEVKTDSGLIDLRDLEKKADKNSALIINSLAGYIAPQPLKEISEICRNKKTLLIEDASGSIGQEGVCDGSCSDIIVCSFGKWKPVNLGYGGFISTNQKEFFELDPELFMMSKFHEQFYSGLMKKLEELPARINYLQKICHKIKSDFKELSIIHKNYEGLNVIIKFRNDDEREKIINYCRQNKYEFTLCPRYIRVMDNAISVEVKRLNI